MTGGDGRVIGSGPPPRGAVSIEVRAVAHRAPGHNRDATAFTSGSATGTGSSDPALYPMMVVLRLGGASVARSTTSFSAAARHASRGRIRAAGSASREGSVGGVSGEGSLSGSGDSRSKQCARLGASLGGSAATGESHTVKALPSDAASADFVPVELPSREAASLPRHDGLGLIAGDSLGDGGSLGFASVGDGRASPGASVGAIDEEWKDSGDSLQQLRSFATTAIPSPSNHALVTPASASEAAEQKRTTLKSGRPSHRTSTSATAAMEKSASPQRRSPIDIAGAKRSDGGGLDEVEPSGRASQSESGSANGREVIVMRPVKSPWEAALPPTAEPTKAGSRGTHARIADSKSGASGAAGHQSSDSGETAGVKPPGSERKQQQQRQQQRRSDHSVHWGGPDPAKKGPPATATATTATAAARDGVALRQRPAAPSILPPSGSARDVGLVVAGSGSGAGVGSGAGDGLAVMTTPIRAHQRGLSGSLEGSLASRGQAAGAASGGVAGHAAVASDPATLAAARNRERIKWEAHMREATDAASERVALPDALVGARTSTAPGRQAALEAGITGTTFSRPATSGVGAGGARGAPNQQDPQRQPIMAPSAAGASTGRRQNTAPGVIDDLHSRMSMVVGIPHPTSGRATPSRRLRQRRLKLAIPDSHTAMIGSGHGGDMAMTGAGTAGRDGHVSNGQVAGSSAWRTRSDANHAASPGHRGSAGLGELCVVATSSSSSSAAVPRPRQSQQAVSLQKGPAAAGPAHESAGGDGRSGLGTTMGRWGDRSRSPRSPSRRSVSPALRDLGVVAHSGQGTQGHQDGVSRVNITGRSDSNQRRKGSGPPTGDRPTLSATASAAATSAGHRRRWTDDVAGSGPAAARGRSAATADPLPAAPHDGTSPIAGRLDAVTAADSGMTGGRLGGDASVTLMARGTSPSLGKRVQRDGSASPTGHRPIKRSPSPIISPHQQHQQQGFAAPRVGDSPALATAASSKPNAPADGSTAVSRNVGFSLRLLSPVSRGPAPRAGAVSSLQSAGQSAGSSGIIGSRIALDSTPTLSAAGGAGRAAAAALNRQSQIESSEAKSGRQSRELLSSLPPGTTISSAMAAARQRQLNSAAARRNRRLGADAPFEAAAFTKLYGKDSARSSAGGGKDSSTSTSFHDERAAWRSLDRLAEQVDPGQSHFVEDREGGNVRFADGTSRGVIIGSVPDSVSRSATLGLSATVPLGQQSPVEGWTGRIPGSTLRPGDGPGRVKVPPLRLGAVSTSGDGFAWEEESVPRGRTARPAGDAGVIGGRRSVDLRRRQGGDAVSPSPSPPRALSARAQSGTGPLGGSLGPGRVSAFHFADEGPGPGSRSNGGAAGRARQSRPQTGGGVAGSSSGFVTSTAYIQPPPFHGADATAAATLSARVGGPADCPSRYGQAAALAAHQAGGFAGWPRRQPLSAREPATAVRRPIGASVSGAQASGAVSGAASSAVSSAVLRRADWRRKLQSRQSATTAHMPWADPTATAVTPRTATRTLRLLPPASSATGGEGTAGGASGLRSVVGPVEPAEELHSAAAGAILATIAASYPAEPGIPPAVEAALRQSGRPIATWDLAEPRRKDREGSGRQSRGRFRPRRQSPARQRSPSPPPRRVRISSGTGVGSAALPADPKLAALRLEPRAKSPTRNRGSLSARPRQSSSLPTSPRNAARAETARQYLALSAAEQFMAEPRWAGSGPLQQLGDEALPVSALTAALASTASMARPGAQRPA